MVGLGGKEIEPTRSKGKVQTNGRFKVKRGIKKKEKTKKKTTQQQRKKDFGGERGQNPSRVVKSRKGAIRFYEKIFGRNGKL